MANQNSINTDVSSNADGMQMGGGVVKRILKWLGADVTLTGSGSAIYTFPSATSTLIGDNTLKIVSLSSNATANATTTNAVITGLTVSSVAAGNYTFKYMIRAQSSVVTTSLKFAVNFTGTVTSFMANLFFPSQGVTAATGLVDQESNTTTGQVWSFNATRVKNTTLGPGTDVDTINADILYIIEGMMTVTVAGDLQLLHGSETAASTQVMAGTSLVLTKVG